MQVGGEATGHCLRLCSRQWQAAVQVAVVRPAAAQCLQHALCGVSTAAWLHIRLHNVGRAVGCAAGSSRTHAAARMQPHTCSRTHAASPATRHSAPHPQRPAPAAVCCCRRPQRAEQPLEPVAPLHVRLAHQRRLALVDVVERQQPVLAGVAGVGRQLQAPAGAVVAVRCASGR